MNQTGGTITAAGLSGTQQSYNDGTLRVGDARGSVGIWNVSGTANLSHRAMNVGVNGAGTVRQTGGRVAVYQPRTDSDIGFGLKIGVGDSQGQGTYEIFDGSLTVENGGLALEYAFTTGNAKKIAPAAAKGTFRVIGGRSTIQINGNYDQNVGSTLAAELDASGLTRINVNGDVAFAAGSLLDVDVGSDVINGTYTLLASTGTLSGVPTFTRATDLQRISMSIDTGLKQLNITVVPEPTGVLAGVSVGAISILRRRNRRLESAVASSR